jgi:hypothetical protein
MPHDAKITIYPGGKLVLLSTGKLHNSCGEEWAGIELVEEKKKKGGIFVMEGGVIENTPLTLPEQP